MKKLFVGAKLLRNWTHLKRAVWATETLTIFLAVIGGYQFMVEVVINIFPASKTLLQSPSAFKWCIFGAFVVSLWKRWPTLRVCERLNQSDVTLEVCIADMFNVHAAYVIPVNTSFDTNISAQLVSAQSLHGQFIQKFYDNREHLDVELRKGLAGESIVRSRNSNVGGKSECYAIGTVVQVAPKRKTAYLLAISEFNEHGNAESNFEHVKTSLASLWSYIASKGEFGPVVVPIIGTGQARINQQRNVVIQEIIRSFVAACGERKFASKLIIAIAPQDYSDHELDLHEIHSFLKHVCQYTEIDTKRPGSGTAVD